MVARLRSAIVVLVCVLVGGLAFAGSSALAAHVLSGSFGALGSGAGEFSGPAGVAVNEETGNVYVVDRGNNRVEEFDSTGSTLLGDFNGAAAGHALFSPEGIAIDNSGNPLDPSDHDVYVVDTGNHVVDKFSAAGVYESQISTGAQGAALGTLDGVAVDTAGVVWIYQENSTGSGEINSYSDAQSNEFLSSRVSPFGTSPGFAVDSEDNLYVNRGVGFFAKLNSAGEKTPIEALDEEESVAAAVDSSNGNVYVDNVGSVAEFSSSGSLLDRFGAGHLTAGSGLAVNGATQTVYVADTATSTVAVFADPFAIVKTTQATGLQVEGSATLNGTVNPLGVPVTSCEFEYGIDESYGQAAECTALPSGSSPVAVHADVSGLTPGTLYHYRLVANNENGGEAGADGTFFTPARPRIAGESATDVASSSATLNARINPDALDTNYSFEYGTSTAYGTSTPLPDGDAGVGTSDVLVSVHLSSLSANTTYHWRVSARNANGTSTGIDHTFVYETASGSLPDGRAYEMVTPPGKNGALIGHGLSDLRWSIARDGSRVIALSIQCLAGVASCPALRREEGEPYEFTRTSGDWVTTPLAPAVTPQSEAGDWTVFDADAGTALFSSPTPPLGEDNLYARQADGSFVDVGPVSLPSRGAHGPTEGLSLATADLSHVVYTTHPTTQPWAVWPFDATSATLGGLVAHDTAYEYAGNGNTAPVLVGVSGGSASTDLISTCGAELGGSSGGYDALSANGRMVYFTALTPSPAEPCTSGSGANAGVPVLANTLYARIDGSRTVLISGRSPLDCTGATGCLSSAPAVAEYQGASADASKAFFTDTQQLTDSASEDSEGGDSAEGAYCSETTGSNGCNLYEYDFTQPTGHNLLAVSAGDTSGGGPRVQGVMAISEDGSHVYFLAEGVLSAAANSEGKVAQDGGENLYVFERDASHPGGKLSFIATLPRSDEYQWRSGLSVSSVEANVTPDGRFLVFTSHGLLTADDTSTSGAAQVFRYDAQSGELVRISVGEHGFGDNGNGGTAGTSAEIGTTGGGDASIASPRYSASYAGSGPVRTDPTMSDDGAYVFFQSPSALTSRALNDLQLGSFEPIGPVYAQNVYEYHDGQVYLISDGRDAATSQAESAVRLLGADATGGNVFFTAADQLVAQDTDTQVDIYDARVCTASDPCIPSAPPASACQGETCQGATGAAPLLSTPVSSTFSGAGNIAAQMSHAVKQKKKAKPKRRKKPKHGKKPKRGKKVKRGTKVPKAAKSGKHTKLGRS